ncbi:uncharacterized protein TrAtP1_003910 [Trichoderma atroviride]|uniref:uncharacterized protein n=1 Tax=Hypocrea atroviridis TaxID=63577 RepID=UPI003331A13D|nr:hypothetical protein TrAtP1_003910 [Trichoderma atroviride]
MGSKRYGRRRGGGMAARSWTKEAAVAVSADGNGSETRIERLELREQRWRRGRFLPKPRFDVSRLWRWW